ncbi:MAG TPA: MFS transporter [Streptosporangiaceae bacterium]|nr:MFS transporter [Streptosporangiaceae bacterium]
MPQRVKVSIVVCSAMFMAGLDLFIVNLAFPQIGREFHGTSLPALSWVLTAYATVYAALLVPAGRFADRAGRKRSFLIGVSVFTVSSLACAAAPSVAFLIAGRVVQAAGAGMLVPPSLGLLLPEFPPQRRQAAVGLWASAASGAAAAGPPLGGLLTQVSWRLVFLVNVPVGLAALVAGRRILCEMREADGPQPDGLGAAALACCVGVLALAITQGPAWGWTSGRDLGAFGAAAALGAVLARRSLRHPAPVIEAALLRVRSFAVACLAALVFFLGFGAFLLSSVLFLTGVWHASELMAGLMLAPAPLTATLISARTSGLIRRLGQARAGALGAVLVAAANGWFLLRAGTAPRYAAELLPGLVTGGAGVGLVIPALTGASNMTLPPARFATGTAVISMTRQVGMVLGVAILTAILGTSTADISLSTVRDGWALILVTAVLSAGTALAIGGQASVQAPDAAASRATP